MTLNDPAQINQALNDMYNVFQQLPMEAEELFMQKLHEYMSKRNNSSIYVLNIFKQYCRYAIQYGLKVEGSSILEIGGGKPLGTGIFWNYAGARNYTCIDRYNQPNLSDIWLNRINTLLEMNPLKSEGFDVDSIISAEDSRYILNEDRIHLIQGSFEDYPFAKESFDYIYSCAVLEHFADVDKAISKMHDLLSRDGIMIHQIDLREHHTNLRTVPDKDTSIDFLKYSKEEWEAMYPPGSEFYINRLRASDYIRYFEESGFGIIHTYTTKNTGFNEKDRTMIHQEFQRHSFEDLSTTGIKIVLKKDI